MLCSESETCLVLHIGFRGSDSYHSFFLHSAVSEREDTQNKKSQMENEALFV